MADAPVGFVVVDKPAGMTSHDVVSRMRRIASTRRVGHAGTLDPMATGVLVLGVGAATRLLTYVVGVDKAYDATIRLGVATSTDDADGEPSTTRDTSGVTDSAIEAAIADLTGDIDQVPSSVSAIKIDGKRAYARVRGGEEVVLRPRPVRVARFDVLARRPGTVDGTPVLDLDVRTEVSSGTYIRALARDLGRALGVGGHLSALRRRWVGPFTLEQAHSLEALSADLQLIAPAEAAAALMPTRQVDVGEAAALGHGKWLAPNDSGDDPVAALGPDGALVAILVNETRKGVRLARPVLVLAGQ